MRKFSFIAFSLALVCGTCSCDKAPSSGDSDTLKSYAPRQAKSPKKGVAFNFEQLPEYDIPLLGPAVSWSYNWSNNHPTDKASGLYAEYGMDWCPMVWNGHYSADNIRAYKKSHPQAQYILAFNEPNLTDQANMIPSEAAKLWPAVKALAAELNMKIISPAMNYGTLEGYHDPIKWLDEFFACEGVSLDDVDGIAVHCYMGAASAVANYISMFKKYGKPIWLTEFCHWDGNNISEDAQMNYMCETLNYLEAEPAVERYAWFIPRGNYNNKVHYNLLTASSPFELTPLGKVFVNFSTQDKSLRYKDGEVIPAEHYNAYSGQVHCVPATDETGILDLTNLKKGFSVSYQLELGKASKYIELRVNTYMKSQLTLYVDGESNGTYSIESTDSTWDTVKLGIEIPSGKHTLTLEGASGAAMSLNYLVVR